jgi:hypothetical protein
MVERLSSFTICLLLINIFYHYDCVNSYLTSNRFRKATLRSSKAHNVLFTATQDYDEIVHTINNADVGKRLLSIATTDLPMVGELYESGNFQLCIINGLKSPNSIVSGKSEAAIKIAPLLKVLLIDASSDYQSDSVIEEKSITVDVGQLTTIWNFSIQEVSLKDYATFLSQQLAKAVITLQQDFPVNTGEQIMKSLYKDRINGRGTSALSKKDIQKISSNASSQNKEHIDQVLRKSIKAGHCENKSKLIDSFITAKALFQDSISNHHMTTKLLSGAKLLAIDAEQGGRFKRSPCIFISASYSTDQNGDSAPSRLNLLNGGWLAVDKSVKVLTEAKKFVQHSVKNGIETSTKKFTAADERIMYRLECFALGEELKVERDLQDLELDVRETLRSMDLPLTPEGAQQALVKVGVWSSTSQSEMNSKFSYTPFPSNVLDCAASLRNYEKKRRQDLYNIVQQKRVHPSQIEGRVDLTQLPALCIDAKRASFRDDAIGMRLRSSTGRKVVRGSKWEILVHIADVSDLYVTQNSTSVDFTVLRKTAESRGSSRYDLPLGPLHLIPPVALEALALDIKQKDGAADSVNRCLSIWAYIDENTGKIIDSGLERTLIQQPIALSFEEATDLLNSFDDSHSTRARQIQMLLRVIEKSVTKWKNTQLRSNVAAQQREKRLNVKEMIAKQTISIDSSRDDGAKGSFQRTRGHKLVDYTLDLYGTTLSFIMKKANAPIPRVSGSGEEERGGRVGSAPLRRYIDGMIQRQALSVLCNYGDPPMTKSECLAVNKIATEAVNKIANHRSSRSALNNTSNLDNNAAERKKALRRLESHFASLDAGRQRVITALTAGVNNQVIISGIGLRVTCKGVHGTLKGGERVRVHVTKLDSKTGTIEVKLASNV